MSPPRKKNKKRTSLKSVLFIAEGLRDKKFLIYLKSLYMRSDRLNIFIRNGMGGAADNLVKETLNALGSFDKRVTVIDNDKKKDEMERARKLANDNDIKLFENTPCIEALFLAILCDSQNEVPNTTGKCKIKYKKEFLKNKKIEDHKDLLRMFPKKKLNYKRKRISTLNEIISVIEGKFNKI